MEGSRSDSSLFVVATSMQYFVAQMKAKSKPTLNIPINAFSVAWRRRRCRIRQNQSMMLRVFFNGLGLFVYSDIVAPHEFLSQRAEETAIGAFDNTYAVGRTIDSQYCIFTTGFASSVYGNQEIMVSA